MMTVKNKPLISYLLKKTFHPEIFQGGYKTKNYFEGWYFKLIDLNMKNALAVIPGVSFGKSGGDSHAFVQVMDAKTCRAYYLKYDISDFQYNDSSFEIEIGGSYFSGREIRLSIERDELSLRGRLSFHNAAAYPGTLLRPGVMGPFTFVPFMECYHGIVNMHHDIRGQLNVNGSEIDFSNGYGYIEKDWGRSFPEAWIWLQSNHFGKDDVSLMFSLAKIPWLGRYFLGLISFLRIGDRIYHFATYTKARVAKLNYMNNSLEIIVEDRQYKLEIAARHSNTGVLKAPKNGLMHREILESITAAVTVRLSDKDGTRIYEGAGVNTGLEIESGIFKYFEEKGT